MDLNGDSRWMGRSYKRICYFVDVVGGHKSHIDFFETTIIFLGSDDVCRATNNKMIHLFRSHVATDEQNFVLWKHLEASLACQWCHKLAKNAISIIRVRYSQIRRWNVFFLWKKLKLTQLQDRLNEHTFVYKYLRNYLIKCSRISNKPFKSPYLSLLFADIIAVLLSFPRDMSAKQ